LGIIKRQLKAWQAGGDVVFMHRDQLGKDYNADSHIFAAAAGKQLK
jgi:hypothetical protein